MTNAWDEDEAWFGEVTLGVTEKLDLTVSKLAPYQAILGLIGIGVAIWTILDLYIFKI